MTDTLGMALATIAATTDPEMFLVGGGVSRAGDVLFDPLVEHYKTYASSPAARRPSRPQAWQRRRHLRRSAAHRGRLIFLTINKGLLQAVPCFMEKLQRIFPRQLVPQAVVDALLGQQLVVVPDSSMPSAPSTRMRS